MHTRLDAWFVRLGGDSSGYIDTISCSSAGMTPNGRRCKVMHFVKAKA